MVPNFTIRSVARRAAIVCSLLTIAFGGACRTFVSHKTDAVLERHFLQHREDFNRLAKLVAEDKNLWRISAVSIGFGWQFEVEVRDEKEIIRLARTEEISTARREEYARLLNKLDLNGLIVSKIPEGTGVFCAATVRQTDATDSDTKGFVYIIGEKPTALRNSLDEFNDNIYTSGDPAPEYKNLQDNWYLFFSLS